VRVGLKREAVAHVFFEGGHLDDDLIGAGLKEGDDILAGAIGLRPVDGAGAGLGDRHLSVFDYGAGGVGDCPRDGSAKFLGTGASGKKEQRGEHHADN
jgi:hypothetical protein